MVDKAREIALKTLYKIDKEGAYSNIALNEILEKNRKCLNEKDIGLISEIVYGVTTWKLTIDEIIKKYSKIKLKKISPWILNNLRMGIYQIIFLDRIPKSAAVNEAVNLAKRYGNKGSFGFTNAVLRKVSKDDYEEFSNIKDDKERLSKKYSMPIWIIECLMKEKMPIEKIEEICKYSNEKPKLTIRVNKLKTTPEILKEKLENKKIKVEKAKLDSFLYIQNAKNIENIEEFKEGLFTVQDEGAGLIPFVLNPKSNEIVLDACSSPGGKTTYMAELMQNKGKIIAWDMYEHRVKLVEKVRDRLGISIIETKKQDATVLKEEYLQKFDKILLDVPCSGLGVLKRKPDIKWQRTLKDIEEIANIQMKILTTCSKYLKNNGEIIYSTCTILKEENEKIIEKFLEKNSNFKLEKIEIENKMMKNYTNSDGKIQLYPNENNDGFFICKLVRKL